MIVRLSAALHTVVVTSPVRRSQHRDHAHRYRRLKVKELLEAEGATIWPCASPCVPADAVVSRTRCSSTATSPPTTRRPPSAPTAAVNVVVDPASRQLLEGATLDYKDGLNQPGFSITNPNATRTCGCGSSFS